MPFASLTVEPLDPAPDPAAIFRNFIGHGLKHILFFDSAKRDDPRGRYSYLTANPTSVFNRFDDLVRMTKNRANTIPGLPPFQGGLAGLFGYDWAYDLEVLPALPPSDFPVPKIAVGLYPWVIAWDHQKGEAWIVSQDRDAVKRIKDWMKPVSGNLKTSSRSRGVVSSSFTRPAYTAAVRRAIDYIEAGDCFQVNIAQTLQAPMHCEPWELYLKLRERNPAPFAAYFDLGDAAILSASPERFLKVTGRDVETRPIKGTRPRGKTPVEDAERIRDLLTSPKDRAENVMIVDLLRNDIGKVCEYGSVVVPRVCEIETFETVHHMVSEVRGRLREDKSPLDLLKACFPGGSVTGAPKVRAMEIIAELEGRPRGAYCGSLGFVGFDGAMDTNILIRTITASNGWWTFPVGGGIVADSDPEKEYEETLHKAAGLLKALE